VTSGGRFKLDVLKNKAKRSLTSSLENIFSRVRLNWAILGKRKTELGYPR
jgi:hypothetical protein